VREGFYIASAVAIMLLLIFAFWWFPFEVILYYTDCDPVNVWSIVVFCCMLVAIAVGFWISRAASRQSFDEGL